MADFEAKLDELAELVGDGVLSGTVGYDQIYAQYRSANMKLWI